MESTKLPEKTSKVSGRRILDLLIEFAYLAVVFLIPLWFAYLFPTYNIFEFNKMILFRILVWLLFFFTIVKIIFYPPRLNFLPARFFKKYWFWPLIFIVGLTLALIFSVDPTCSFYGTIERQIGISSYWFYFLWFVLVSFNLLTINDQDQPATNRIAKNIRRLLVTAVISGSLVSLYGFLQILNLDFIIWPEPAFLTHRVFSSLGQPNFLASWLLMVAPLSFYLFYTSRRFLIKFAFLLAAGAQLLCLLLTGSRGGLLAALLVAFVFLIRFLLISASSRFKKYLAAFGFLILVAGSFLTLYRFFPDRVKEVFNYNSGSTGARVNFYLAAGDAIKERLVFGYGLETGREVFIRYYSPDWAIYGDVGQSADRAHNLFLDILLTTGFYGLILFTVLYYFFFSLAAANRRRGRDPNLPLALMAGVSAYLLSLLFSFTIVTGEIYFWLFLAILVAINYSGSGVGASVVANLSVPETDRFYSSARSSAWRPLKIFLVLILAIAVFSQISRAFNALIADYYFNRIYYTLAARDYFTAFTLDDYLRAQRTNPVNQEAYDIFWAEKLSSFYPTIEELTVKGAAEVKIKELDRSLPPRGYKSLLAKARLNNALGNFSVGDAYLTQVIAITPSWPLVYLETGKSAAAQGDTKKAIASYLLAALNLPAADDPRLNQPHQALVKYYYYFINERIAVLFAQEKNWAAAEKYYRAAYQNNPVDFTLLKKIADTYYHRGDLATAIKYNLHGLARHPDDYQWSVALAALYYESGDKDLAFAYLQQAKQLASTEQWEELENLEVEYQP